MLSWIEIAQPMCLDPVVAASVFKPNAPGRWELASLAALSDRQLLKGNGRYFAERALVAVTTLEVLVIDVGMPGAIRRRSLCWRRDELVVRLVTNRDGRISLPALSLSPRYGLPHVELAPRDADPPTVAVLERLVFRGLVAWE